jgi:hypothetical protein
VMDHPRISKELQGIATVVSANTGSVRYVA